MLIDPIVELAKQLCQGLLTVAQYLELVEQECNRSMPVNGS